MNFDPLDITVDLVNDKVQFTGALRDNAPVTVDYIPPFGDGEGYTSLELFLMSLATCVGSTVLIVLRKMRKTITGCRVSAQGIRRNEHPTGFAHIALEVTLHSPDVTESELQRSLQLAEASLCPVWGMIQGNVEVTVTTRLLVADSV